MYELFCDFNEVQMWFKQKLCSVTFVSKRIIILNMVSFFAILAFFSDMIFFSSIFFLDMHHGNTTVLFQVP